LLSAAIKSLNETEDDMKKLREFLAQYNPDNA
jgi:hypothetical protein